MSLEEMSLEEIEERLAALALKEAGKKQQLPVLTIEDIAASRSNQLQLTDAEQAIFDAQQQELALAAQALEEAKVKSKQSDIADISPTDDKPLPEENVRRSPKERTNRFGEYFRPVYDYVGEHPLISIAGTGAALGMGAVALNQARQGEEQTFEEPFYEPTPVGAMPASFSPRWA
jgi:hypothetical protein